MLYNRPIHSRCYRTVCVVPREGVEDVRTGVAPVLSFLSLFDELGFETGSFRV